MRPWPLRLLTALISGGGADVAENGPSRGGLQPFERAAPPERLRRGFSRALCPTCEMPAHMQSGFEVICLDCYIVIERKE